MKISERKCVLVFRSAALGDFILACPALAMLRRIYPGAQILLLTIQSANRAQREKVALYAGGTASMPWVDLARPHLVNDVVVLDDVKSIRSILNVRKTVRSYCVDQAVLLLDPAAPWMGRLKKIVLIWLLVGFVSILGWRGKGSLKGNKARLKRLGVLRHHVHGPLQFISELLPKQKGYTDTEIVFDLRPSNSAKDWATEWFRKYCVPDTLLVAIAPGSIQPHKKWPLSKFQGLCERLLTASARITLVVIGTPADSPLGDALVKISPTRVFNLAGKTTISESAALLSRCQLLVGNDGGAMHLGDAMGAMVVSIVSGIEYPDSIEPWHNKQLAIRHEVDCAPCYSFTHCPKGHNKCISDLPIEAVFSRCLIALQLLAKQ